jgi:hypothetical protein
LEPHVDHRQANGETRSHIDNSVLALPEAKRLTDRQQLRFVACRAHRVLHRAGKESEWWSRNGLEPLESARSLWTMTHPVNGA